MKEVSVFDANGVFVKLRIVHSCEEVLFQSTDILFYFRKLVGWELAGVLLCFLGGVNAPGAVICSDN